MRRQKRSLSTVWNGAVWGTLMAALAGALCLGSCSTLGIPSGQGWSLPPRYKRGTVEIESIRVDKTADWDSVEDEARRLLPLLLAAEGYETVRQGTGAANAAASGTPGPFFRVHAVLIEREYMEKWKTLRSLSAEIRLFRGGEELSGAMGKALLSGGKTLSSSRVLHDVLKKALSRALEALGDP